MVDDEAVKALQIKVAKPLFEVNLRLVASAGSPFQANDILDGLTAGFGQFGSPMRNDFRIVKPRNPKNIVNDFIYRIFDDGEKMMLSAEEIASILSLADLVHGDAACEVAQVQRGAAAGQSAASGLVIGESDVPRHGKAGLSYRRGSSPAFVCDRTDRYR